MSSQYWMHLSADVRPDENVELFTLHLHVVLLLIELVLKSCVDLHQFVTAQFLSLCLQEEEGNIMLNDLSADLVLGLEKFTDSS